MGWLIYFIHLFVVFVLFCFLILVFRILQKNHREIIYKRWRMETSSTIVQALGQVLTCWYAFFKHRNTEGRFMWQLSQQGCRHSYLCKMAKHPWPYQWGWILLTDKQSSGLGPRRKIRRSVKSIRIDSFYWWRMQSLWDLCCRDVFYSLRDKARD